MKTTEPRSLLSDFPLLIDINPDLINVFIIWKKKFIEKTGKIPSDVDCMYAGYILSNPIVREEYKKDNQTINVDSFRGKR